ncbi:Rrf2 family transcriptional regulator [Fructobacillus sp. M2-14]|uniref:Rrf2 family transcriptional regulator n=1 Tax=Fructobacillus broussonetiae TaxID=2713173 RepID=A0ABS5R1B7_9LACO|nr:Rrf2 family transcriptional regulator [Fructobacillus broussonetiae]
MKPSLKLTNAVHILVYIANTKPGDRVVSKDIAQSVNTNPSRVRALMSDLFSASVLNRRRRGTRSSSSSKKAGRDFVG